MCVCVCVSVCVSVCACVRVRTCLCKLNDVYVRWVGRLFAVSLHVLVCQWGNLVCICCYCVSWSWRVLV